MEITSNKRWRVCQRPNAAPARKTGSPRAVAEGCSPDSEVDELKVTVGRELQHRAGHRNEEPVGGTFTNMRVRQAHRFGDT